MSPSRVMRRGHMVASGLALGLACARSPAPAAPSISALAAPAKPGSGEPNLTVTPDGRVLLSWIEPAGERRHALRYSARTPGSPWSEPRTIAEGSEWFVNWADLPAIAALPDGALFAHWLKKQGPETDAYDVLVASSHDGGRSWSAPVVPHRDGTQTEHGFVSMTPWTPEAMGIVWLDGRKTSGAAHGEHAAGAETSLVHTTLGRDGRLGEETVLDGRVCDCCQTDAVRVGDATVVVYRDRSEKEVRDMSVVRFSHGAWSQPQPLARDGWEINGCPVNGPAIAAAGPRVAAAWFTAAEGQARVRLAFSSDSGSTFGSPVVLDDGRPLGRVDVVVMGERAVVSWLEQTDQGAALRLRTVAQDGSRGPAMTLAESSAARSSGFPRMVESQGELVLAWRDSAEPPTIRTAVVVGVDSPR